MTADELKLLHDVFARYREVAGAWLFGSHARGTARPDGDVDVAVDPATPDVLRHPLREACISATSRSAATALAAAR